MNEIALAQHPDGEFFTMTFPLSDAAFRATVRNAHLLLYGKDVTDYLDLANSSRALDALPDKHKVDIDISAGHATAHEMSRATTWGNIGPNPVRTFLTERGVYRLVMRSNKPEAEDFQEWLAEVAETINHTGSYGRSLPAQFDASNLDHVAQLAQIAALKSRELAISQARNAELEPKAAQADQHREADGLIAVGDFANQVKRWAKKNHDVKVTHTQVWDFLGEIGLIIRGKTIRRNQPTAFAIERDFVRAKQTEYETKSGDARVNSSPRLTPAGEGWAWDRGRQADRGDGFSRPIPGRCGMRDAFASLAAAIVARNDENLMEYGPAEQIERAVEHLERFAATTPIAPVYDKIVDLAGFGEAPVHFASAENQYLLLSEVAEQLGMPVWTACKWANGDHQHAIRDQREADEERGDGRLGYEHLRDLVDLGLWFIADDPEAKPDANGRRWSDYGDWLISHDRLPAFILVSPWGREFMDNTMPAFGYAMRHVWGDRLKTIPTYGADGQPTGGNAYTDLFRDEGLTEEEAQQRARRGPSLPTEGGA